jgi:arylsulfatase A-like enzyme
MAEKKPNILILWGDDIGWWNISYNSRGQMATGRRTSTVSPTKASPSPTIMDNKAALLAALHSSPVRTPSARA